MFPTLVRALWCTSKDARITTAQTIIPSARAITPTRPLRNSVWPDTPLQIPKSPPIAIIHMSAGCTSLSLSGIFTYKFYT
jgi:hypothetical protein